mgnify:CR=1 FL=1
MFVSFVSGSSSNMGCCNRRLFFQVFLGISEGLLVLTQGTLLNYYIISQFSDTNTTYFFFLGDFICIFLYAGTLTVAYRYLIEYNKQKNPNNSFLYSPKRFITNYSASKFGVLPLIYVSWAFYVVLLLSKIAVIFTSEIPEHLSTKNVAGPQLLKVGIALSGVIFLILVEGHNWSEPGSPRYLYVSSICTKTGIEILDSVSFLSILLSDSGNNLPDTLTPTFISGIVAIAGVNFLLPVLILYKLSLGEHHNKRLPVPLTVLHNLLHVFSVDMPYFAIRLLLWVRHNHNTSIFIMKNAFGMLMAVRNIYPDLKLCLRRDPKKNNVEYLPGEKIIYVDEMVGDDEKIGEPMDELKKVILEKKDSVITEK